MKFKIDENLTRIARLKGEKPETTAIELCKSCIDAGLFTDEVENYGVQLCDVCEDMTVKRFADVLAQYLNIKEIPSKLFDVYCGLIVVGDGNCPDCGGDLEPYDSEGHSVPSGSYDIPPEYVVTTYIYKCPVCGKTIKSEYEL